MVRMGRGQNENDYPSSGILLAPGDAAVYAALMRGRQIRIAIIEDQQFMAEALQLWLQQEPDYVLIGHAADGVAGWDLCRVTQPDLVLVDVEIPKLDGLALAQRLLQEWPVMRILLMSGLNDPHTIWRVSQSGVHGFIGKTEAATQLRQAVRTVADGGTFFGQVFQRVKANWLQQPEAFQKILTDREQEVLRLVATGADDERIAIALGISVATVGVHRKHIRQKLALHNDRELIGYARQWGLDKPPL
jgi:DNA-binding NarL/FixJ family response regulator